MAKKPTKQAESVYEGSEASKIFKSVTEHYKTSWDDLVSPNISGFTEKEALLLGKSLDSITGQETNSGVFDPRLSTISLERCGRVMAQNPSGKSLAMSSNDRGKNMLMNLLTEKWILPNANSQMSFLMKSRMWDLYSLMYGVMFSLVDTVNTDKYQGPDFWLLPIRHCRPQPGKFSIKESDHFGVSTWVSPEWLAKRPKETWRNIDKLLMKAKGATSTPPGEKEASERTYIEQERQPTVSKSKDFKSIEIYTEYRKDRWITIAPGYESEDLLLRDIKNPHNNDEIPIVAKYCFPLMDSIYGLGEFERGKTLQYALNSLWNLYLDGVKMSIFPPIQMVADDIVPSSIIMEPAAKWLLTKQGAKIETFNVTPQGINTFQNTYNYLIGAILNLAGTTDTTVSQSTDPALGKTPQALKLQATREGTRDAWDRFMMEEALQDVMGRFVNLTVDSIDKDVEMRLFASEIEEIAKVYPDVVEMVEGDERGLVKIGKKVFKDTKFDYEITKGSTYKADQQEEQENTTSTLNFTLQNYEPLQQAFAKKGKEIDIAELYQRSLVVSGTQDWEKIITDMSPESIHAMNQPVNAIPDQMPGQIPGQVLQQMPQVPQVPVQSPRTGPLSGQFQDPQIAALASKIFGGQNG